MFTRPAVLCVATGALLILLGTMLARVSAVSAAQKQVSSPSPPSGAPICAQDLPPDDKCSLSPMVPPDLSKPKGDPSTLESLQQDFDVLSWYTFIAINWPTKEGSADASQLTGQNGDGPALWESWKESYEVFLPDGSTPKDWGSSHEPPSYFSDKAKTDFQKEGKAISKMGKGVSWFQTEQPFDSGPLIDQTGRYARFEILMNRDMFEYIVHHQLYSIEGQERYERENHSITFPCGTKGDSTQQKAPRDGAIVVKASWKILTDEEAKSGRFHVREAVLYSPKEKNAPHQEQRVPGVKIGLVGLHIVHKSEDSQQWTWSTFEQVDNSPEYGEDTSKKHYSFFSANSPNHTINSPPPRPWDPTSGEPLEPGGTSQPPEPAERRSEIVRLIPISKATRSLNTTFQNKLREVNPNSVWQYYQLISTQWPTRKVANCSEQTRMPADLTAGPAPVFLGNSTLESYIQGQVPNTSSSCMDCHANAIGMTGRFADFSYLLQQAKHAKPH